MLEKLGIDPDDCRGTCDIISRGTKGETKEPSPCLLNAPQKGAGGYCINK